MYNLCLPACTRFSVFAQNIWKLISFSEKKIVEFVVYDFSFIYSKDIKVVFSEVDSMFNLKLSNYNILFQIKFFTFYYFALSVAYIFLR